MGRVLVKLVGGIEMDEVRKAMVMADGSREHGSGAGRDAAGASASKQPEGGSRKDAIAATMQCTWEEKGGPQCAGAAAGGASSRTPESSAGTGAPSDGEVDAQAMDVAATLAGTDGVLALVRAHEHSRRSLL